VTSSWKEHQQSKRQAAEKDFKRINKIGVKNGATDPKVAIALKVFRKQLNSETKLTSEWLRG